MSLRVLEARVRRALRRDGERLCVSRGSSELGVLAIDDRNIVAASGCSISGLATELGLINQGEEVQ